MRLVNLDEKNNDRYKVVLSRKDWGKILLVINYYSLDVAIIIVFFGFIILYVFYNVSLSNNNSYSFIVVLKWVLFYGLMLLFAGLIFRSYYNSFTKVLRPFHFRGMVIDVVGKKILLKNKTFSFKDTDTLVFYLEKNMEKDQNKPKNNKKNVEKEKKSSGWVYYVKKKAFSEPNSGELGEKGFLDNNSDEFIILPVEIKYMIDYSLVLGEEGLLGVWRQIAVLLGVGFEENIEFEEEILLQASKNAFHYKKSNDSSINQEGLPLVEKEEDEKKMREVLSLLRQKVGGKDALGGASWRSTGFEEYLLFKEELMGVRTLSTGFELRFWSGTSEFPGKKSVINKKFVLKKLIIYIGVAIVIISGVFVITFYVFSIANVVLKLILFLSYLLIFINSVASDLENSVENARSKEFLFRIAYLLKNSSILLLGIISIIVGLYGSTRTSDFKKAIIYFLPAIIWLLPFFGVLSGLYSFSCAWNLRINRYMSRLVFSFEDKVLEGEYGFCVSRTHWQAPASKVRSLALLKTAGSSIGSDNFLLAIKIDKDYVVLPLPKLEEDKIRELLFFLQQVFNTLLASYSLNNIV